MEIEKLEPVSCTICKGTRVFKKKLDNKSGLACSDCSKVVLPNGKVIPLDAETKCGAIDPSFEMGDRIENSDGVHEFSGSFCNRIVK